MAVPHEVCAFGNQLVDVLRSILGNDLVGAYFVGSVALGGYVPGESDVDVIAVCEKPLGGTDIDAVVDKVLDATATCPARGLEFTVYRSAAVSRPSAEADFELNVNGGPRMPRSIHLSSAEEPPFWYVIDRAIAHRSGVVITGRPPAEVFADIPRGVLLQMMRDSMRWHRKHEEASLYSVLNASRAWRFALDDVLGSKLEGATWARKRWRNPSTIDAAVDLRHGREASLDAEEVDALLGRVEEVLSSKN